MNDQSNLPARQGSREASPLGQLNKELEQRHDSYRMALPSHIKPEDLQRTVVMAAQQNPKLLEADRRTLMLSCMKAAQDGLLPDGREAALVPFSTRKKDANGRWSSVLEVQYMPMVYGLRKKILQSDEIATMTVGLVYRAEYESGRFLYDVGMEPPIRHKPDLELSTEQCEDDAIIAAYSLVKFKDGSWSGEVMRRAEIDKIQNLSQTGSKVDYQGKPREPKGPWADHYGEMAKKTVMRRHSKVLPMSGDIFRDVEGEEVDRSITSATRLLDSVDEAAPVALPSHDEETGEVHEQGSEREPANPATGMTEVDEETARALDAGEEPMPEENEALVLFLERVRAAEDLATMNMLGDDWNAQKADFNDDEQAEVENLMAARRKRLPDEAPAKDEAPEQEQKKPSKADWLETLKRNIGETLTLQTLKNWDKEWEKSMASFDDDTIAEVEALFTAKRKELSE